MNATIKGTKLFHLSSHMLRGVATIRGQEFERNSPTLPYILLSNIHNLGPQGILFPCLCTGLFKALLNEQRILNAVRARRR